MIFWKENVTKQKYIADYLLKSGDIKERKEEGKVDDFKINIQHDSSIIKSRLIDGIYPELSRLIPKEYNYKLEVDSKELSNLIDKAIVVSFGDAKIVKL